MADLNTSYNDDIVYNNSQSWSSAGNSTMPAFDMPIILQMDRVLCVVFGIPLNLVALNFVRSKHRRFSGHSGIFWVTVIVFNIFSLIQSFIELGIHLLNHEGWDEQRNFFCQIYSVIVGCPYALILTTLTLGTADRYSSMAHPQFYRNYITKTRILWTISTVVILIIGGHTSPYWTDFFHLNSNECEVHFGWLVVTLTFHGFISGTCFALQIRLYLFIRSCINYSATSSSVTPVNSTSVVQPTDSRVAASVVLDPASSTSSVGTKSRNRPPSTNSRRSNQRLRITTPSGKKLSRLEMRAARILALGILPFCLINFPAALFGAAFHFTRVIWGLEEINRWIALIMLVFRELILFHLIYIPIILMAVQNGKSNSQVEAEHYRMNRRPPRRRVYRLREMPINSNENRV